MSETKEQQALIEYAMHVPELRDTIFAVPNGAHLAGDGKQKAIQIARLKREGLRPGVFDLVVPVPILRRPLEIGEAAGLFLEMKTRSGSVSKDQQSWGEIVRAVGYEAEIAFGLDHGIRILDSYVKRIRAARRG